MREAYRRLAPDMSAGERSAAELLLAQIELEAVKDKQKILNLVPKGWLSEYLGYTQISEAPDSFHLFCALAMMSHLIGRRIYFRLGLTTLYAPLSIFLMSPAGAARRSTSINSIVEIGKAAGAEILQDQMSPEGLLDHLRDEPQCLVVADEAASLLSRSEWKAEMPAILCSLLDCRPDYKKKLRGSSWTIVEPTVNTLIGCAPEWLLTSMPASALKGGLFSRMILVYEPVRKRLIAFPSDEVEDAETLKMKTTLVETLRTAVGRLAGRMTYSPGAKAAFEKFYVDNDHAISNADDKMSVYIGRKPEHVHRLLMTLLVARADQTDLVVTEDLLAAALGIMALIEEGMSVAYQTAGLEKSGQLNFKVLRHIEKAGGRMSRSELLRKGYSAKELTETLGTLVEAGLIYETRQQLQNHKPTMVYETAKMNGGGPRRRG